MTPEAQRIAIAEACRWEPTPEGHFHPDNPTGQTPPDYLNDLNAMHEAEKVLHDLVLYGVELAKLTSVYSDKGWPCIHPGQAGTVAHATAAQRAEAFLRTIGKWEDSE